MEKFGKFVLYLLVTVASSFLYGTLLIFGWKWFITPLGAPEIRFWHAMGLSLLVRFTTFTDTAELAKGQIRTTMQKYTVTIGLPVFILTIMWVYHMLM